MQYKKKFVLKKKEVSSFYFVGYIDFIISKLFWNKHMSSHFFWLKKKLLLGLLRSSPVWVDSIRKIHFNLILNYNYKETSAVSPKFSIFTSIYLIYTTKNQKKKNIDYIYFENTKKKYKFIAIARSTTNLFSSTWFFFVVLRFF